MSDKSNKYSFIHLSEKSSRFKKLREFSFVESCTSNANFDKLRNDGMSNIYLAVQNKDMKVSIRSIDVSNDSVVTDTMVMNVSLKDGTDEVTVFGSDLTDDGIIQFTYASQCGQRIDISILDCFILHIDRIDLTKDRSYC